MKQLGNPDALDWLILALVFLQAYWNYRQFKESEKEMNRERTA